MVSTDRRVDGRKTHALCLSGKPRPSQSFHSQALIPAGSIAAVGLVAMLIEGEVSAQSMAMPSQIAEA